MWSFWKRKTWDNRKIAFVSILIATSVAFVLITTKFIPIAALPSFKIMVGGLPIKLTGYIFGPIIGAVTGLIADLISFLLVPVFYNWWYALAFSMAGFLPGLIGWLMHRRWRKQSSKSLDEVKYNNINFLFTLLVLVVIVITISVFVFTQDDSVFANQKIIKNKFLFLGISLGGCLTMFFALIIFRLIFSPKTFNQFLPIIAFSALIELCNNPLVTLGDMAVFELEEEFITILTTHFLLSPVKIWGNLIVIFFAYKVVSPLIYSKTGNGWEEFKF